MAQNKDSKGAGGGERTGILKAERWERIAQLVLRRSKLSAEEIALLREISPQIFAAHHEQIWNRLRRRGLDVQDAEDLEQETFLELHLNIIEHGFPDSIPKKLNALLKNKILNHVRTRKRAPFSGPLPSSSSEKPTSGEPDIEHALDLREVTRRLLPQLSPEHHDVVRLVIQNGLTHPEAADVLGIPEGTVKSRLLGAKGALMKLIEPFLPPSQRGLS